MASTGDRSPAGALARPLLKAEPTTIFGSVLTSQTAHLAYLTNDTDAAIRRFDSLGVGPWDTCEMPLQPIGAWVPECVIRASFAHMAERMLELVEPLTDGSSIFPPPGGRALKISFHHVGAFMDVDIQDVATAADNAGLDIHRFPAPRGGAVMVDTRDTLGHWLEVLCFARLGQHERPA